MVFDRDMNVLNWFGNYAFDALMLGVDCLDLGAAKGFHVLASD